MPMTKETDLWFSISMQFPEDYIKSGVLQACFKAFQASENYKSLQRDQGVCLKFTPEHDRITVNVVYPAEEFPAAGPLMEFRELFKQLESKQTLEMDVKLETSPDDMFNPKNPFSK